VSSRDGENRPAEHLLEHVVNDLDVCPSFLDRRDPFVNLRLIDRRPERHAERQDLAVAAQLVQGFKQFVITDRVNSQVVKLIKVNTLRFEPLEVALASDANKFRRPILRMLTLARLHAGMIIEIVAGLGGDDNLVATSLESLRQQDFSFAVAINIRCVERIDAEVERPP